MRRKVYSVEIRTIDQSAPLREQLNKRLRETHSEAEALEVQTLLRMLTSPFTVSVVS